MITRKIGGAVSEVSESAAAVSEVPTKIFVPGVGGIVPHCLRNLLGISNITSIYPEVEGGISPSERPKLVLQYIKNADLVMCHSEGFARVIYAFHYMITKEGIGAVGDWFNDIFPKVLIIISPYFSFYRNDATEGILDEDMGKKNIYISPERMTQIMTQLRTANTEILLYRLSGDFAGSMAGGISRNTDMKTFEGIASFKDYPSVPHDICDGESMHVESLLGDIWEQL